MRSYQNSKNRNCLASSLTLNYAKLVTMNSVLPSVMCSASSGV